MSLGVLCGVEREARIARRVWAAQGARIALSGATPEGARRAAELLVSQGATSLLSFGLAGALDAALKPGDLLLPSAVIGAEDRSWTVDTDWRAQAARAVPEATDTVLLGLDQPARTPAQKLFLHAATEAGAVDMESHVLADVAAQAGLPFLVLRAISDDLRTGLPDAAMAAIRADGSEDIGAVLGALMRRPQDIPPMIRLGMASGRGFRALGRVAGLVPVA